MLQHYNLKFSDTTGRTQELRNLPANETTAFPLSWTDAPEGDSLQFEIQTPTGWQSFTALRINDNSFSTTADLGNWILTFTAAFDELGWILICSPLQLRGAA